MFTDAKCFKNIMKFHFDGKMIIIFQDMPMLFQGLRVQSARMIQEFDKKLQTLTRVFSFSLSLLKFKIEIFLRFIEYILHFRVSKTFG